MKRLFLGSLLIVSFLMILLSCVSTKQMSIPEKYSIYGAWSNPRYTTDYRFHGKIIFHRDGRVGYYYAPTFTETEAEGEFIIDEQWYDTDGFAWYKLRYREEEEDWWYALIRIRESGMKADFSRTLNEYPEKFNADDPTQAPDYHYYDRL